MQEEAALRCFRAAPHRHPELKPLAVYHRAQRSRQGDLREGDPVPPLRLADTSCRSLCLGGLSAGPRPLVLLAGSWS